MMSSDLSLFICWVSLSLVGFILQIVLLHKSGKMVTEHPKHISIATQQKENFFFQLITSILGKTLINLARVICPYTKQSLWPVWPLWP